MPTVSTTISDLNEWDKDLQPANANSPYRRNRETRGFNERTFALRKERARRLSATYDNA